MKYFFILFITFCGISISSMGLSENSKVHVIVVPCMHYGILSCEDNNYLVDQIIKRNPAAVIILGSVVDTRSIVSVKQLWKRFDQDVEKISAPVYFVSHECTLLSGSLSISDIDKEMNKKEYVKRGGANYYSFTIDKNLFLCIDSENLIDAGSKSKEYLFLEEKLKKKREYRNIFVITNTAPWIENYKSLWFDTVHVLLKDVVTSVVGKSEKLAHFEDVDSVKYINLKHNIVSERQNVLGRYLNFIDIEIDDRNVTYSIVPLFVRNQVSPGIFYDREDTFERQLLRKQRVFSSARGEFLRIPEVIQRMQISSGMKILDLGAGAGFFTFKFAEALQGTGMVYATDIESENIDALRTQTAKLKYTNVMPIKVNRSGDDAVYKENVFDRIFMCGVYELLDNKEVFLHKLRKSLQRKEGRLYILIYRNRAPFTILDVGDCRLFLRNLKVSKGPILGYFSPAVLDYAWSWHGELPSLGIRQLIVKDLNSMLEQPIFNLFSKGISSDNMYSLFVRVDRKDIKDINFSSLSQEDQELFFEINKELLVDVFFQGETIYDDFRGRRKIFFPEKGSIIRTLRKAGFELLNDYDVLPYHHFLEFRVRG